MSRVAYFRVSTEAQSIEAQRKALGDSFDREFTDEGVSGAILAADRPGFAKLLDYIREGYPLRLCAGPARPRCLGRTGHGAEAARPWRHARRKGAWADRPWRRGVDRRCPSPDG